MDRAMILSGSFHACDGFCASVTGRLHRETGAVPVERLAVERARLHVLPSAPCTAALGETRLVNTDQTIRFGSVRYSTPPGLVGAEVWVRVCGDELVIVADVNALPLRRPSVPAGAPSVPLRARPVPTGSRVGVLACGRPSPTPGFSSAPSSR
jgi:hypothetical protein